MIVTRAKNSQSGFTLIELLAAVAIFSIVMASAYTIIGTGIKARDKHNVELQQNARAAIGAVSDSLASAVAPGKHGEYDFTGGASEISFHTFPDGATGPVRIEYFTGGNAACAGLCRRISQVPPAPGVEPAPAEPVAGGIKTISFEYLGKDGWEQTWSSSSGMPLAVRITAVAAANGIESTFEETAEPPKIITPEESATDAQTADQK